MSNMTREYHRRWRAEHKESIAASQKRYRETFGPGIYNLIRNHTLSVDEAREVIASKPNACEICGREMKLYYDHDHSTGQHRGWLCNRCNVSLSLVESPDLLESAVSYLEANHAAV